MWCNSQKCKNFSKSLKEADSKFGISHWVYFKEVYRQFSDEVDTVKYDLMI